MNQSPTVEDSLKRALKAFEEAPYVKTRARLVDAIDARIQDEVWKEHDRIYRGLQKIIDRMINESSECRTESEANIQVQVMERFETLLDSLYPFD